MALHEIEVGEETYTVETASAKNQWDAFHIVSNCQFILALKQEFSEQAMVVTLMQTPKAELDKITALLIKGNVTRLSDDVPVGINLFHDDAAAYALLMAKVVRANLSESFSKLLGDKGSADAQQSATADQA